jgi:NADH:ubiquinone oxidoreductase subunit 6 (subunit J)
MTLFYLFSSLAILSAVMVIRVKNPVHSVLFLILAFCNAAGLMLLLNADFFAMIFLVVYVGAIAVLFLFVVMMLNIKITEISENTLRYLPVGSLVGLIFVIEIVLVIQNDLIPGVALASYGLDIETYTVWKSKVEPLSNIAALGQVMYTLYFYYFLMGGFILLVAMIGAILLTLQKGILTKRQEAIEQNYIDFQKTVYLVKKA